MAYKVFISHSGTDTWVAKQIESHIQNTGSDTFMDAANIDIGDQFEEKLLAELKLSKELLVLFTPWSLERPYVWMEIGAAWVLSMRIVVVLHGLSNEGIITNPKIPVKIKASDVVIINDLDDYFEQLKKRVILINN